MIFYFLPMILFLGLVTSYTDIIYGKIKNKHVLIGMIYAIIVNIALIIYYKFIGEINQGYVYELITNAFFSVAAGFILWNLGIWSAADGKLFIAFSLLIPLDVYEFGYEKFFPGMIFLTNIFICSLIVIILWEYLLWTH